MNDLLKFLVELFEQGLGYSGLNTAKSAVSSVVHVLNNVQLGEHVLIRRFIKGVFQIKPSLPRYNCTWEVDIVLNFLKNMPPLKDLSLLELSRKLVTLLALVTGQRSQTLHSLDVANIECSDVYMKIRIKDLLKQSKPNKHLPEIFISKYLLDNELCVVNIYRHFIERTKNLRTDSRLFIKTQKPFTRISKATISHWIKDVLTRAGIDMTMFAPHSTRSAACSMAVSSAVPIDTVLRTAGWSKENTFRKYYNRPVTNDSSFSGSILSKGKK